MKMFESSTAFLKLNEMNPILNALLKFYTTKNLFKDHYYGHFSQSRIARINNIDSELAITGK